jgi:hypothetical protein
MKAQPTTSAVGSMLAAAHTVAFHELQYSGVKFQNIKAFWDVGRQCKEFQRKTGAFIQGIAEHCQPQRISRHAKPSNSGRMIGPSSASSPYYHTPRTMPVHPKIIPANFRIVPAVGVFNFRFHYFSFENVALAAAS